MAEEIARQLVYVLAGAFLVGGLLIGLIALLGRGSRSLWTAYAVEAPILAVVLVPAYLGGWALGAAALAIGVLAGRELLGVLARGGVAAEPWTALGVGAGAVALATAAAPETVHPLVGPLLVVAMVPPLLRGLGAAGAGGTLLAALYPGVCLAHLVLLGRMEGGFGLVVFLYALVEANDAFALLFGKLLGRRRLWPRISPNKTLEGSLGGLAATLVCGALLGFAVPDWGLERRVLAALVIGVAGPAGDLAASAIKRAAGVKDYGAAVPGSGGVMDVYDSLVFAAPLFYAFARLA